MRFLFFPTSEAPPAVVPLTISGVTGMWGSIDLSQANGVYLPLGSPQRVGYYGGSWSGWQKVVTGGGTFDNLYFNIYPQSYDEWSGETTYDFGADDSLGYDYLSLGGIAAAGAPIGSYGSGISATGTTNNVTVSCSPVPGYPSPEYNPMPYGVIPILHGEGFVVNIPAQIYDDNIMDWIDLTDIVVNSVSQGTSWGGSIDNITANQTIQATYS